MTDHGFQARLDEVRRLARAGELDRAAATLEEVAGATLPERIERLDLLGRIEAQRGRERAAVDCWRRVLELDPGHRAAVRALATLASPAHGRRALAAVLVVIVAGAAAGLLLLQRSVRDATQRAEAAERRLSALAAAVAAAQERVSHCIERVGVAASAAEERAARSDAAWREALAELAGSLERRDDAATAEATAREARGDARLDRLEAAIGTVDGGIGALGAALEERIGAAEAAARAANAELGEQLGTVRESVVQRGDTLLEQLATARAEQTAAGTAAAERIAALEAALATANEAAADSAQRLDARLAAIEAFLWGGAAAPHGLSTGDRPR